MLSRLAADTLLAFFAATETDNSKSLACHNKKTLLFKLVFPGRIKKRAAHSENFLGGLVCMRNLAFRLQ